MKSKNPGHKAPLLCASASQLLRHQLEDSYILPASLQGSGVGSIISQYKIKEKEKSNLSINPSKSKLSGAAGTVIYTGIQF